MKKLQEMIALRATKNEEFQAMELTDETREAFDALELELGTLDSDIERLEKQEKRNQQIASVNIIEGGEKRDEETPNFIRSLGEYLTTGELSTDFAGKEGILIPESMFRANPILTSTDAGIINKIVNPEVNIKTSFGEQFLRDLGVNFIPGITGNLVMPSMVETFAVNTAEAGDSSTADQAPTSVTYSAKRVDTFQAYTREFLAQTSTYPSLLQSLVNGIGIKHVYNFFDNMQVDAVDASVAGTPAGLTYGDILDLEANLADVMGDSRYVTTPAIKAYLKNKSASAAGIKFIWSDQNEVVGLPATSANGVNANQVWLGDFSKADFVTFGNGGIEVILDPYSLKKKGQIEVYAVQLADSGTANYRNFSWVGDASAAL